MTIYNKQCGSPNAGYHSGSSTIVLCDEFLALLETHLSRDRSEESFREAVLGGVLFTMLHEAGHALVDQLELPVLGREEDTVDAMATYLLLRTGADEIALAGAESFVAVQAFRKTVGMETPLWDAHSLDEQRVYNILCWVYGSNPGKYGHFVTQQLLPEKRAALCPEDYQRTSRTLDRAFAPHLRTPPPAAPGPSKLHPVGHKTVP